MRRLIAIPLLLATVGFQIEPAFGEAPDGAVHHESTAGAWLHGHDTRGGRASDGLDAPTKRNDEHGRTDHYHDGTGGHCTHVHGVPLICPGAFTLALAESSFDFPAPIVLRDIGVQASTPPPRL